MLKAEDKLQIKEQFQMNLSSLDVTDVHKAPNGQNLHTAIIRSGELAIGTTVVAKVDVEARKLIIKNHTATHLLHKALKEVLR